MTKVNLKLLDDIEMHLMVEKGNHNFSTVASISTNTMHLKCLVLISGVRGGVSTISTRYCKANNRFMQYYNEKKRLFTSWIWIPIIFMVSNTKLYSNLYAIHYINNISLCLQLFSISSRLGYESVTTYRCFQMVEQ